MSGSRALPGEVMIAERRLLHTALLALLAAGPLAAQQPPDPATHPNVKDIQITGTKTNKLEVTKTHEVKVKEIWKYVNGTWVRVWNLEEGGDYILSNNDTKKSRIQNNPQSEDFNKDDKFRVVVEATDAHGNSVTIEKIEEKT